eukprot:Skav208714  [mRNA]  locus=scaffold42:927615:928611:+ [translate_table: standard]
MATTLNPAYHEAPPDASDLKRLLQNMACFQETQHQMDGVLRGALDQLERAQSRKLEFLQSMKRQVTTQLLFIQWLDNFQAHARMALPPAESRRRRALGAAPGAS